MLRKFLLGFILFAMFSSAFAAATEPKFVILPNVNTKQLMLINASRALSIETKAIEVVKQTLNITSASPYRTVRINLLYDNKQTVGALIVYLLSSQYKSFELVRINVDANFNVISVINNYRLQKADLMQLPAYAHRSKPTCPDKRVQFVIGNNFDGDQSVEREVRKVFKLAKNNGYRPVLMDVNDKKTPQPTIQAYENWLSCPNVKGFYNESHGWEQGILLSDGDFSYFLIDEDLIGQLNNKVTLFDSCETFHDPLLDSVMNTSKGNAQQYVAGIISLPFGASERTASCFWDLAFKHSDLNRDMLNECSRQNQLQIDGFGIGGNGDNHLIAAH